MQIQVEWKISMVKKCCPL